MEDRSRPRAIAFVALLLLVGGFLLWKGTRPPKFTFTIVFTDSNGLKRGHKVNFKGVAIGEVADVALTPEGKVRAQVWLYEADKDRIREGATGRISENALVNVSGEKAIEMFNAKDDAKPIAAGAELQGVNSYWELQAWRATAMGKNMSESISKQASEWYDRAAVRARKMYDDWQKSSPGKPGGDVDDFLKRMREVSESKAKDLEKEWPDLEARFKRAYDKLTADGDKPGAQRLQEMWREFRKETEPAEGGGGK